MLTVSGLQLSTIEVARLRTWRRHETALKSNSTLEPMQSRRSRHEHARVVADDVVLGAVYVMYR